VENAPPIMADDEEDIQHTKRARFIKRKPAKEMAFKRFSKLSHPD
jgi:hypothetical protein